MIMIAKFAVLCGLFLTQAWADETPAYRFSRPVLAQDNGQQSLLAVPLDSAVYANTAADFRDLRLVDQNGVETPYLLQKIASQKTVSKRVASTSKTVDLQKFGDEDEGFVVTVQLDKNAANADGLSLITDQRDFEYALQIHGSNDGENWQLLVERAQIYDYSRYMSVGNRDVELPANSFRQFKIVVAKASQTRVAELLELTRTVRGSEEVQRQETTQQIKEPLHVERIELWHNASETVADTDQQFDYPAGFKIKLDAEQKATVIDVDTLRQPLNGLKLQIMTPNFSRQAEVQIPLTQGLETQMRTIGTGTLEALHYQDINREQTAIGFPEQRQTRYRIVIRDQDNPELHINTVAGTGPGYQLLFLPQTGLGYQIKYGAEAAEAPHYDTAPIQELLRRGYPSNRAGLGPETEATIGEQHFNVAKLLNSSWFLGLVITLMVVVLAWSLFRVSKRVANLSDSTERE
ncbi:hypothetical protein QLH52_14045 [Methylomonas sp. OY6]|uniref:DUF3999 domain-containing protein n=1 Tax=Methylomonas defluvii TaxID=3045149 RepID=A0ABU4UHU1_9GAMM|nr:hypothetical protein [Methylomonas sp. OY6]MDX8128410.1 hypothetical protein [Methylomonas sp. OY6]